MAGKRRRRADGSWETRTIDEMLAEAAADDVVQKLPGHGRPLDLGGYHRADPETRAAARLLKDHDVIPQPLQDRKEAEQLASQAEAEARRAVQELAAARAQLAAAADGLHALVPAAVLAHELAPQDVPAYLQPAGDRATPEPVSASKDRSDPAAAAEACRQVCAAVAAHNHRRAQSRRQVESLWNRSAELARRLNEQVMMSRLPAGVQLPPVKVAARLAAFDEAAPALPPLPDDLPQRLQSRLEPPSVWQRLRCRWRSDAPARAVRS